MRAEAEESVLATEVETISEGEFKRLCEEIYRDRSEVYSFRPDVQKSEALVWMLLGCLISLLSVNDAEVQALVDSSSKDLYGACVHALVQSRARPPFDSRPYVEDLKRRVEGE